MTQEAQQVAAIAATFPATMLASKTEQTLYTVEQMAEAEPAFSEASIRNIIFKAEPRHSSQGVIPGNGLLECGGVVRIGRKVLINRKKFLAWAQK